jgi:hypothetical protein
MSDINAQKECKWFAVCVHILNENTESGSKSGFVDPAIYFAKDPCSHCSMGSSGDFQQSISIKKLGLYRHKN